jgi:hypothetical protein
MVVEFTLEQIVRLRKAHPCGSFEWRVTRLGADIGLRCTVCRRYILLPRSELERKMKGIKKHETRNPKSEKNPNDQNKIYKTGN